MDIDLGTSSSEEEAGTKEAKKEAKERQQTKLQEIRI